MDSYLKNTEELKKKIDNLKKENNYLKKTLSNYQTIEDYSFSYKNIEISNRYHSLLHHNNDALIFLSLKGNYLEGNKKAAKMLGYSDPEIKTLSIGDVLVDCRESGEILKKILREEKVRPYKRQLRKKDGKIISVIINVKLIKDETGTPSCLQCIIRDITKIQNKEKRLKKLLEDYEQIFQTTKDGIFLIEVISRSKFKYLKNNKSHQKKTGFSLEFIRGKSPEQLLGKKTGKTVSLNFTRCVDTKKSINYEELLNLPAGIKYWNTTLTPLLDNGKVIYIIGICQDITDYKITANALQESRKSYQLLLENLNEVIYILDDKAVIKYISPNVKQLGGYKQEELIGKQYVDLVYPADIKGRLDQFKSIAGGMSTPSEYRLLKKDGTHLWVRTNPKAVRKDNGIIEIQGTLVDITDRKLAEESLSNNITHLKSLVSILQFHTKKTEDFLNYALEKAIELTESKLGCIYIYDEDKKELRLNSWSENVMKECSIVNPETVFQLKKTGVWGEAVRSRKEIIVNDCRTSEFFKINYPKGHIILNKFLMVPVLSSNNVVAVIGVANKKSDYGINDVVQLRILLDGIWKEVDRIRSRDALMQSEQNFKTSIAESPLGIRILDKEGRTLFVNKKFLELYEFKDLKEYNSATTKKNHNYESYMQFEERKKFKQQEGKEDDYEINIKTKSNKIKYLKVIYKEVQWNGSSNYQMIYQDITEQKKLTEELLKAKEKAEESDRLKSAFLANMSHEIRTPMNGIMGFAELLKESENIDNSTRKEYINLIEKSGRRMLNIINDLVDISKIESGQMKINIKPSNINTQMEYLYSFFKPEVEAKGMELFYEMELTEKEAVINTDSDKLYAILSNLIKNAIKYSKEGFIKFGYRKKENYLEFFVKDTGIGIPEKRQKAIFERFIQADIDNKMALHGAGLGLAISKAYVEMLKGQIRVESKEKIGSTFYFTLPYNKDFDIETEKQKDIQLNNKQYNFQKMKILIVEDDEVSFILLKYIINEFSNEIINVKSGKEAIEMCHNNPDINLILMDIQIPGMDGLEATRKIREFNKDVIIIAQTAYGLTGDREKCIEAGCNDYISKPINKRVLLGLMEKYLEQNEN